jgi:hypothetical protein
MSCVATDERGQNTRHPVFIQLRHEEEAALSRNIATSF